MWNKAAVENCRLVNGTILSNGTCLFYVAAAERNSSALTPESFPQNHVIPSLEYFQ